MATQQVIHARLSNAQAARCLGLSPAVLFYPGSNLPHQCGAGAQVRGLFGRESEIIEDIRKLIQDFLVPEVRALSAKVDGLQREMDIRITNLEAKMDIRFSAVDIRFTNLEAKFDLRFNAMEDKISSVETRIDQRFDDLKDRLDLNSRLKTLERERDEQKAS